MDENNINKKADKFSNYNNRKKITPALSFIDDDIVKNKKGFNLIKEEEIKEHMDNP